MAHNLCNLSNVYSPVDAQYLCMGLSISSFNATLGLNEQVSSLSAVLVNDCATPPDSANPKVYYNADLQRVEFRGPDPGWLAPKPGTPVYFRVADFEFAGILTGWTIANSESGSPIYNIKIDDPRELLANTNLIIGDYAGGVGNIFNLINCFGYMETFGQCVPDPLEFGCSETFGSALGFGGSLSNGNGIPAGRLTLAAALLTSAMPALTNTWSPYGRIVGQGNNFGGHGVLPPDNTILSLYTDYSNPAIDIAAAYHNGAVNYYMLDLTELPVAPDYFRISGTNISVLDLVSQICDAAGFDYNFDLIPVFTGAEVIKFIKVRTINRNNQPLLTTLSGYITANNVSESSIGQEFRADTTSVFVTGGFKETIAQIVQDLDPDDDPDEDCLPAGDEVDDLIQPFVGWLPNGDAIIGEKDANDYWEWTFSVAGLRKKFKTTIAQIGVATEVLINEQEILCAIAGMDSWQLWAWSFNSELKQLVDPNNITVGKMNLDFAVPFAVNADNLKHFRPMDFMNMRPGAARVKEEEELQHNLEKAYEFISIIAKEYYGRKFMVRVPATCYKQDSESGQIIASEEPADSGWTDAATILDIPNPSDFLNFVTSDDGKILPFVRYDNADTFEVKDLNEDEFGLIGNVIYLKATVEPGYVYSDLSELCSPRVVINVETPPVLKEADHAWADRNIGALIAAFNKLIGGGLGDEQAHIMEIAGKNLLLLGITQKMQVPTSCAIPFRSNVNRYGPWITAGPPGQVRMEVNDDLVPWNFGGSTAMCEAGQALSDEGVTYQQAIETGSITVPGYPVYRGGDEFGSPINPNNVVENRTFQTTGFSETAAGASSPTEIDYCSQIMNDLGNWNGTYGPNITDVNVTVGQQGVLTTYSFRTYIQRAGRLAKINADRIKKIGKAIYTAAKRRNTLQALKGLLKKRRKRGQ